MSKENTILTIDIGGASVKMAEFYISPSGDSISLERYDIQEMSAELAESDFAAAFAETFQSMMLDNGFTSQRVRVSISSLHAFQRLSKLPPVLGSRTRAAQVVEGEAKLTVPYPLEEVIWDYQLIRHLKEFSVETDSESENEEAEEEVPQTEVVEELEAFFVAVKEDMATAIATTLLDADLEVLSIEVAPTAIYNAARANMFGEESCDMILDLGGRGSNLIILDGNRVFVRAIPIGGSTITQQIAKEFNISTIDAEEMKRKHGFVALGGAYEDSDSEVAATISKIARNVMTRLHGEINRSINAWRSMHGGNRPTTLSITGGSSIIPYVPHFLNEKLHLEVSFLNTFPVVNISQNVDKQELLEVAHLFPPMIGMAIRHLRTCPIEIALIPKIIRTTRELQQKKPFFYACAACALLCMLIFFLGLSKRTDYDKSLKDKAAGRIQQGEGVAKRVKSQQNRLDEVKSLYDHLNDSVKARRQWTDLLNDLQKRTPSNMWFTQIDGVKTFKDPNAPEPSMGMDPGMGPGMGPDPMAGGDPNMGPGPDGMDGGYMPPPPPPNEVAWIRLRGHSMVSGSDNGPENDVFRKHLEESEYFDLQENDNYRLVNQQATAGKNNVTSFIIYIKLKNPIKQQ